MLAFGLVTSDTRTFLPLQVTTKPGCGVDPLSASDIQYLVWASAGVVSSSVTDPVTLSVQVPASPAGVITTGGGGLASSCGGSGGGVFGSDLPQPATRARTSVQRMSSIIVTPCS